MTEAESFLESRCLSLEEEQRRNKEQIKVVNSGFHTPASCLTTSFGKFRFFSFFFSCQLQEQEISKMQVSLKRQQQQQEQQEEKAKRQEEELQVALEDKVPKNLSPGRFWCILTQQQASSGFRSIHIHYFFNTYADLCKTSIKQKLTAGISRKEGESNPLNGKVGHNIGHSTVLSLSCHPAPVCLMGDTSRGGDPLDYI